jgi:hypothetical protein
MKPSSIRLPASLDRRSGRDGWTATLAGNNTFTPPFEAGGAGEADARAALAQAVTAALDNLGQPAVLVIGGDTRYAGYLHLILPKPEGLVVYAVHDGRPAGSWHSHSSCNELLDQVRDHVGDNPIVVDL